MLMTINPRGGDKSKTAKKENKITSKEETPVQTVPLLTLSISAELFKFKRTRELTEHIVTTLKTPLVERATHPPSQVREKEIVNICMYVHTKERHERERERKRRKDGETPGDVGSKSQ